MSAQVLPNHSVLVAVVLMITTTSSPTARRRVARSRGHTLMSAPTRSSAPTRPVS
jgi:hypothetical protein